MYEKYIKYNILAFNRRFTKTTYIRKRYLKLSLDVGGYNTEWGREARARVEIIKIDNTDFIY